MKSRKQNVETAMANGNGAKWRITNFKQVARAIANCSYRISDR